MSGNRSDTERRDYERLVAEETLILAATEEVCRVMDQNSETNRKWLAKKLGRSKGFVSQILSGERNLTLRTLARMAYALDCRVELKLVSVSAPPGEKSPRCSAYLGEGHLPPIPDDPSHCALPAGHDGLHASLPVLWQMANLTDGPWRPHSEPEPADV